MTRTLVTGLGLLWLAAPALAYAWLRLRFLLPGNEVGWSFYYPLPSPAVIGVTCGVWLGVGVALLRAGRRAST